MPECNLTSIYDRIEYKCKNDFIELSREERDKLENMIIEDTGEMVTRVTDERLMEVALTRGVVL